MEDNVGRWEIFLEAISKRLNKRGFDSWFKPLRPVSLKDSSLEIEVPNKFFKEWLSEEYLPLMKEVWEKTGGSKNPHIVLQIKDKEEDTTSQSPATKTKEPARGEIDESFMLEKGLNPRYTFDNFMVGPNNQFAHASCLAVANKPANLYNPLFIYGGVGLGKTHLLGGIAHHLFSLNRNFKVNYVTSEKFTNELIGSIRYGKTPSFRNRFREIDVLLLDDIQFIAGKERTQEEIFHTFNALYEQKKQIVMTGDKFPKDIPNLEDRLRSRFEWGLIADIQPPELETRVAIVKKRAFQENIPLPDDVAFFLASSLKTNIRELEGALIRVGAISSFTGSPITMALARETFVNIIDFKDKEVFLDNIIKVVAKFFGVRAQDLKTTKRTASIALPRQAVMYLARRLTTLSFPEIGIRLGGKDHSTIIHGVKKITMMMEKDAFFKNKIEQIVKKIS